MVSFPQHRTTYGQARYVRFDTVSRNRLHRHAYFEPCIVISGTGDFEHGSETYRLGSGDLFVSDPGVFHEIRSVESRDLSLYFLPFHIVTRYARQRGRPGGLLEQSTIAEFLLDHRNHLSGQSQLVPLFEYVTRLARREFDAGQSIDYVDACQLLVRQVLSALTRSARLSEFDYRDQTRKNRIEELIESRLHDTLRVTDIARACGMSERTLRRRWRSWSERSLPDEINHRRIGRACQLLMLPDISIADVSDQVGITSAAQFSRLFKKFRGMSPREYRNRFAETLPQSLSGADREQTEYLD